MEVFKYLRLMVAFDDDDTHAVRGDLAKARRVCARISLILGAENSSARVSGMFFKVTGQAVLLFGSEIWSLAPAILRRLEGFRVKAAWRMTGWLPKVMGGTWRYLKTSEVLEAAGLHMIAHYIQVRSHSIEKWIADRPIYEVCKSVEWSSRTTPRTFW